MKKLLLSLLLFVGSIISFGSCFDYIVSGSTGFVNTSSNLLVRLNGSNSFKYFLTDYGYWCNQNTDNSSSVFYYTSSGDLITGLSPYMCIVGGGDGSYIYSSNHNMSISFYVSYTYLPLEIYNGCDLMTSNECQSNYDLIPISEVDQEYCLGNNFCPEIENGSGDCENLSGDVQWSALYINDIQHLGKPLINISIPDYIFWDYSTDDEEFNLYVGSGYDQEYIDNVISINSYRPDSQDFTDVFVGGLSLVMPYIVIVLFIIFVRKFIKRIFK